MTHEWPGSKPLGDIHAMEPGEIFGREFKRVFWGGYAVAEVDQFLNRVGETVDALTNRVRVLEDRDREHEEQLDALRQMEETLRTALVTSQRFSENIVDSAKREAQALIEEARLVKERAEFEAAKLPEALAEDVRQLREQRARLLSEMHAVIETHENLLNCLVKAEDRLGRGRTEECQDARGPGGSGEGCGNGADGTEPAAFFTNEEGES